MTGKGIPRDERGQGPWVRSAENECDDGSRPLQMTSAHEKHLWKAVLSILRSAKREGISRLLHFRQWGDDCLKCSGGNCPN